MTPEGLSKAAVKRAFDAIAKLAPPRAVHVAMHVPRNGTAGWSDFDAVVCGVRFLIETKADPADGGRGATKLQRKFLSDMRAAYDAGGFPLRPLLVEMVVREEHDFDMLWGTLITAAGVDYRPPPPWRTAQTRSRPKPPPGPTTIRAGRRKPPAPALTTAE